MARVGQASWQAVVTTPAGTGTVLAFGRAAGAADALDAIGALLHHAAGAHRDLGIVLRLDGSAPRLPYSWPSA